MRPFASFLFATLAGVPTLTASAPQPATDDAAAKAAFILVDGAADPNSAPLGVLHDGKGAASQDDPASSFFFADGTDGGRLLVDLGSPIPVKSVITDSWHQGGRRAQFYTLYAADGAAEGFVREPKRGIDPEGAGWKLIRKVDSRDCDEKEHHLITGEEFLVENGGRKEPGRFRYLLFDIERLDPKDPHANTFFNEIDVIDASAPPVDRPERLVDTRVSRDGRYRFVLDSTEAPDLREWTLEKLIPVMEEWYPKIIEMLPVENYTPSPAVYFRLKNATELPGNARGVPGYANGNAITLNASFMRDNRTGEAIGCAVHELVHVVQFAGAPRPNYRKRPPSWVFEGATDYIRWFLFEPEAKGAEITERNVRRAKYDDSYRVTANFMKWVIEHYDRDLMKHINLSIHRGYTEDLWKEWTGKTVQELGAEWKAANLERLNIVE